MTHRPSLKLEDEDEDSDAEDEVRNHLQAELSELAKSRHEGQTARRDILQEVLALVNVTGDGNLQKDVVADNSVLAQAELDDEIHQRVTAALEEFNRRVELAVSDDKYKTFDCVGGAKEDEAPQTAHRALAGRVDALEAASTPKLEREQETQMKITPELVHRLEEERVITSAAAC